jgi:hypothetical protein
MKFLLPRLIHSISKKSGEETLYDHFIIAFSINYVNAFLVDFFRTAYSYNNIPLLKQSDVTFSSSKSKKTTIKLSNKK